MKFQIARWEGGRKEHERGSEEGKMKAGGKVKKGSNGRLVVRH